MNDIYKYILKYGEKSFQEVLLNEADLVIFSQLSYIDFSGIIHEDNKKSKMIDIGNQFFSNSHRGFNRRRVDLFKMIMSLPRYKDLYLSNYIYKVSKEEQFGALTIDIEDTRLVVYEGTDSYLSGWKEDFSFFYHFPTPAEGDAISYLNKVGKEKKELIILGHSKGGHLSLIASMYSNILIKRKIKSIYSFDGPGIRKEQYLSRKYKSIRGRYKKYIPKYSVIGRLLFDDRDEIVVDCKDRGFLSHNVLCWKLEDINFKRSKLSKSSMDTFFTMQKWLEKYSDQELEDFTNHLFKVLEDAGIKTTYELKRFDQNKFKSIVLGVKNIDPLVKKMLNEFIIVMKEYYITNNFT